MEFRPAASQVYPERTGRANGCGVRASESSEGRAAVAVGSASGAVQRGSQAGGQQSASTSSQVQVICTVQSCAVLYTCPN